MIAINELTYVDTHIRVTLSTGERLKLPFEAARIYGIERGKSIDRMEYCQLKEESERFSCRQRAMAYLAMRSRSSRELEAFLHKKGFSGELIGQTILDCRDAGYIDDYDFALRYIRSRASRRVVGARLLKSELSKKGISRELVKKALEEAASSLADGDALHRLAVQRLGRLKGRKNRTAKLVFFLRQRGFNGEDIRAAVDRLRREGDLDDGD